MKDHFLVRLFKDPARFAAHLEERIGEMLAAVTPWLVVAAVTMLVTAIAIVGPRVLRRRALGKQARRIAILPPPEITLNGALTLWMGLHAILRPAWRRLVSGQPHVAWEIVADPDAVQIFLWVPRAVPPGLVERAVESAWPGARATPGPSGALFDGKSPVSVTELVLAEPDCYPIGDAPDTESLRLALGTMTALEQSERAVIQVLARPATSAARFRLRRAARHLRKTSAAAPFWATGAGGRQPRNPRPVMDPTVDPDVRAVITKASSPLWGCTVRVAVSSDTKAKARGKIHALAGAFAVFEGRNGFRRRRIARGQAGLEARSHTRGYLLSVPELAQLATLPSESVPGLDMARARTVAPPRALPEQGRVLGVSDHPGTARRVAIPVEDARHHIHLVGETGTGKSTLITRMVLADANAGHSVVVIDPKGDLVEAIIERLPQEAMDRTCLIDPDDANSAVGLNVLAPGDNPDLVVDHVVGVFKRIYEPWWGPRTDDIMRAVCLTLTSIPGATLTEVPLLLSHEGWRREVRTRLEHVPGLGSFWMWYERLGEQQRANIIAPLLNKLRAFLLRGPVRAIVGQAEPRLDIESLLDSGGLLLVRIPKGTLGEETSRLLGAFVVARVWQAVMRRASVAEDRRADTTLYVDEMHNYLALPRSFEDLLAEARGYHLGLVLAHQHMNQLPRDMREALAANARTKLVFACAPEDATQLERHFSPHLTAHDLQNLASFQAACRPCLNGGHGAAFTFNTEPLEAPVRRGLAEKAREASRSRFGCSRSVIESDIRNRQRVAATRLLPPKPGEKGVPDQ